MEKLQAVSGGEMTAEDKLQELYRQQDPDRIEPVGNLIHCDVNGGVYLAAEHIDLIADLVIERLKKED